MPFILTSNLLIFFLVISINSVFLRLIVNLLICIQLLILFNSAFTSFSKTSWFLLASVKLVSSEKDLH